MNPFEFVLGIIIIATIGRVLQAKYGYRRHGRRDEPELPEDSAETMRLKEEVRALKDRLHVLERIAVDKESSLAREIDDLRNR